MAYQPPVFNLVCNIWDCTWPADDDPTWTDVPVQKYIRSRMSLDVSPQAADGFWRVYTPPIQLRFPRNHSAFMAIPATWNHSCFEVPAGSGQYYRAYWQEVQHQGFPNEYAIILVNPCTSEGKAIGPPLAEFGLGTAPDVCELPPEVEEIISGEFIADQASDDKFGFVARAQDDLNYYIVQYNASSVEVVLYKYVADVLTTLDTLALSQPLVSPETMDISWKITGSLHEIHIVTPYDDATFGATDSEFGIGGYYGVYLDPNTVATCNNFNVYHDLVLVLQDLFGDAAGTNLDVHTMNLGTGWVYLGNGAEIDIDSGGNACQGIIGGGGSYGFCVAFTAFP